MHPAFAKLSEATPPLAQETSKHIGQLINTLLTPLHSTRFERLRIYLILILMLIAWGGFLALFTIGHYNQTQTFTFMGITYTYHLTHVQWFRPEDGIFITLPFLLPGLALLATIFILVLQERYRQQVPALLAALRLQDVALTPVREIHWLPDLAEDDGRFSSVTMGGWQTAGRMYLFMRLSSRIVSLLFISTQALMSQATLLGDNIRKPIDIITSIVFILTILAIVIAELRLIRRPSVAVVDALGVTLPSPTTRRDPVRLTWGEIRALYQVRTRDAYWLLVTDDAIYGWVQSPLSGGLGGTALAQAIATQGRLPVRDATDLCVAAVGEVPATPAIGARWGELFAQTPAAPNRQSLRFDLRASFVLLAFGLALGIAASWVISQFA